MNNRMPDLSRGRPSAPVSTLSFWPAAKAVACSELRELRTAGAYSQLTIVVLRQVPSRTALTDIRSPGHKLGQLAAPFSRAGYRAKCCTSSSMKLFCKFKNKADRNVARLLRTGRSVRPAAPTGWSADHLVADHCPADDHNMVVDNSEARALETNA